MLTKQSFENIVEELKALSGTKLRDHRKTSTRMEGKELSESSSKAAIEVEDILEKAINSAAVERALQKVLDKYDLDEEDLEDLLNDVEVGLDFGGFHVNFEVPS